MRLRPESRIALGAALGCLAAAASGCGAANRLSLHQPTAAPSQRHIELSASGAERAIRGERTTCVLRFPLPGQSDGPPAFLVYLDIPAHVGTWPVNAERDDCARGFLIQTIGQRRGKTVFGSGEVRVGKLLLSPRRKRLELDVLADDGTRIVGRVEVRDDASDIEAFERRHAADVALLKPENGETGEATLTGDRGSTLEMP